MNNIAEDRGGGGGGNFICGMVRMPFLKNKMVSKFIAISWLSKLQMQGKLLCPVFQITKFLGTINLPKKGPV